jgi:endonuclease IV
MRFGLHVSISGGISNAIVNALKMNCNAFQIFSRNPRGWAAKPLPQLEVENFTTSPKSSKIRRDCICVHMPYLPNLSSPNDSLHDKSTKVLIEEIKRCVEFGLGASIWTNNIERGIRLARQVQSGIASINEMVKSDPRPPFGGIKLSEYGIRVFVNIKSAVVKDIISKLLVE